MRQKFFRKTLQSDFIKSLLHNTPLPTYNTVKVGDYIIKDVCYIYDKSVIKCKESGIVGRSISKLDTWDIDQQIAQNYIDDPTGIGIHNFITIVTSGNMIDINKYYLLADYNLRYGLDPDDNDYPVFNQQNSYQTDDIVQHYNGSVYRLYKALQNIPAGTPWNEQNWDLIIAYERPYYLIKCTDSGNIGDIPLGASYTILQEFEPEILLETSTQKIDLHTYYLELVEIDSVYKVQLIYNENMNSLQQKNALWVRHSSFIPDYYYTKFTSKYTSPFDYYDSETHKILGKLLRLYRDVYGLDLMAYYNCWNAEYLNNYQIYNNVLTKMVYTSYKVIKVPIKFNKTYTIAIECDSVVEMIPAFIKLNDFIQVNVGQSNVITLNDLLDDGSVKQFSQLSFDNPITLTVTNNSDTLLRSIEPSVGNSSLLKSTLLQRYENDLYLIIQLPINNTSSIVILEGDYTNTNVKKIFNLDNLQQINQARLNELLLSNLSLLWLNDGNTYPFADRLIEYLLLNVITGMDTIGEDIIRIREKLQNYIHYDQSEVAWSDYLRVLIFDLFLNNSKSMKLDISGYVDKDAEAYLDTLQ